MSRFRAPAVAIWLLGLAVGLVIVGRTTVTTDLSAFLPRAPSPRDAALVDQLRDGPVTRVILIGIDGVPESVLVALSRNLAKRLRGDAEFAAINNGEDVRLAEDQAFLWDHRYLLSTAVTPGRFTEAGLNKALQSDLDLLNSAAGIFAKSALPRDPTGEMLHLIDAAEAQAPESLGGVWLSPDHRRALLVAQTVAEAADVDAQEAALKAIDSGFAAARDQTADATGAHLVTTGPVVFSVATRDRIKGDAVRFSLIATVLVALILFTVYRSPRLLVFGLMPVMTGALAGIAMVSVLFGTVHGITLGFGVTLIGEAVDYPVYLFTQTAPGTRPVDTLERIWPTLRIGVLTSICGFGALVFSSFSGLAQLGVFTIAGLIAAVSVTRWVLPAIILRPLETARPARIGAALRRVIAAAPRWRLPSHVLVAAALMSIAAHYGAIWDDRLENLSPIPAAQEKIDSQLRAQLGAPDVRYVVVVNAASQEAALENSERVGAELDSLVAAHALTGFQSPSLFLPSRAAQLRRQRAIPPAAELGARLERAVATTPFQPDSFAPFLQDAAAAKTQALITRKSLDETSFAQVLDSLLTRRGATWTALLPLRGIAAPEKIAAALGRANIPGVLFLDIKRDSDAMYAAYRHQATLLALFGIAAIAMLLFATLRRPGRVAAVLAPLAAATLITGALLIVAGGGLNIFHLVGLLLVVAVGSNYSLFFEREPVTGEDRAWVIASLVIANMCTVIGFGVLSLSVIPVLHGIGMTVAIGTVLSLGFSAVYAGRHEPRVAT